MKTSYSRGFIGLFITMLVGLTILASIGYNAYYREPGGFIGQIQSQLERPGNIWNSIISGLSTSTTSTMSSTTTVTTTASISADVNTAGWKIYTNNEFGFSFKYPPEWTDLKISKEDYRNTLPENNEMEYRGQAINIFFSTSSEPQYFTNKRPIILIRSSDYWGYTMSGFIALRNCQNSTYDSVFLCRPEKIGGKDSIYGIFANSWPEGDGTMYAAQSQFFSLANVSFPTVEVLEILSDDWDKDWIKEKNKYGIFDFQKYNENVKRYTKEVAEANRSIADVKLFKTFISTFKFTK